MLKRGTMDCPDCKKGLHWHQIHGMRLVEEPKGKPAHYKARCPQCGNHYEVKK